MRKLRGADLFCGAGGTTEGAEASEAVQVQFALNHWQVAVDTHSANFPHAKHVNSRLEQTSPSECDKIDLLFASPECTHHSRARGGRPTSDQQRSGAWYVLPWIEHHRPSFVVIENVSEFTEWGPVGNDGRPLQKNKGAFFDAWIQAIKSAGYQVDYQFLNAADFGAATSRSRLFVIARKGNRQPVFPEPTHSRTTAKALPGMELHPWRAAHEIIDWSLPCPSIFGRKRPLADKTLLRIEAGLRRFVEPFVVKFRNNEYGESMDSPVSTITAGGGHHGLAVPFVAQWDNQNGGGSYVRPVSGPLATMTTKANMGVVMPFMTDVNHGLDGHTNGRTHSLNGPLGTVTNSNGKALIVPFISKQFGTHNGAYNPNVSLDQPLGTVTTKDHNSLVITWVSHYYGTDNQSPVSDPLDTITTKHRHAVCAAMLGVHNDSRVPTSDAMRKLQDTMRDLGVCDIGFRMLQNAELSAAQGFRPEYVFTGTKADITRQIGNSVSPPVAREICLAIAG